MITSRYLSLGTESDEDLQAQLQAILNLIKQSIQSTPPPQITAGQQLQGQLALSASIADALKRDPAETEDLGLLMSGRQADLSSAAWCKAARFYRHAFGKADRQETVVEVHCAASGNLESVRIVRSSGDRAWDRAALEAVKRSDPMPLDESGQAPRSFMITMRPGI